jgi:Flp pilus assembly protein TadD
MACAKDADAEHDRLHRQAVSLLDPLLDIQGRPLVPVGPTEEATLRRGIELIDRVLQLNPHNWAAMWIAGKAYQRLRDFDRALQEFARAHAVKPDQPDVAREASIAAMDLGRPAEAIGYCETAIRLKPGDPGLRANLALALLFTGQIDRAGAVAEDALRRDPSDTITARIVAVCRAVRAGERPCPRHARDLS